MVSKERYGSLCGVVGQGGRLCSGWWREIMRLDKEGLGYKNNWFSIAVRKVASDGQSTYFWKDLWLDGGPFEGHFSRLFSLSLDKFGLVSDIVYWHEGRCEWNWRWMRGSFPMGIRTTR